MYKIYHNPRCKKSRAGLKFLEDRGFSFEIVKYCEVPINAEEIKVLFKKMNFQAKDMIRKQEEEFRLYFKNKELTNDEWIEAIIKFPKLLKRPIVLHGDKAVWGDPASNIESIID